MQFHTCSCKPRKGRVLGRSRPFRNITVNCRGSQEHRSWQIALVNGATAVGLTAGLVASIYQSLPVAEASAESRSVRPSLEVEEKYLLFEREKVEALLLTEFRFRLHSLSNRELTELLEELISSRQASAPSVFRDAAPGVPASPVTSWLPRITFAPPPWESRGVTEDKATSSGFRYFPFFGQASSVAAPNVDENEPHDRRKDPVDFPSIEKEPLTEAGVPGSMETAGSAFFNPAKAGTSNSGPSPSLPNRVTQMAQSISKGVGEKQMSNSWAEDVLGSSPPDTPDETISGNNKASRSISSLSSSSSSVEVGAPIIVDQQFEEMPGQVSGGPNAMSGVDGHIGPGLTIEDLEEDDMTDNLFTTRFGAPFTAASVNSVNSDAEEGHPSRSPGTARGQEEGWQQLPDVLQLNSLDQMREFVGHLVEGQLSNMVGVQLVLQGLWLDLKSGAQDTLPDIRQGALIAGGLGIAAAVSFKVLSGILQQASTSKAKNGLGQLEMVVQDPGESVERLERKQEELTHTDIKDLTSLSSSVDAQAPSEGKGEGPAEHLPQEVSRSGTDPSERSTSQTISSAIESSDASASLSSGPGLGAQRHRRRRTHLLDNVNLGAMTKASRPVAGKTQRGKLFPMDDRYSLILDNGTTGASPPDPATPGPVHFSYITARGPQDVFKEAPSILWIKQGDNMPLPMSTSPWLSASNEDGVIWRRQEPPLLSHTLNVRSPGQDIMASELIMFRQQESASSSGIGFGTYERRSEPVASGGPQPTTTGSGSMVTHQQPGQYMLNDKKFSRVQKDGAPRQLQPLMNKSRTEVFPGGVVEHVLQRSKEAGDCTMDQHKVPPDPWGTTPIGGGPHSVKTPQHQRTAKFLSNMVPLDLSQSPWDAPKTVSLAGSGPVSEIAVGQKQNSTVHEPQGVQT